MTETTDAAQEAPPGLSVTIDGRAIPAAKGELVIDAAERSGIYIPRFCYHPRMRSVGMCRMCIVDIDTGRGPALQPSCMIECADGMIVSTGSPATRKAQEGVLEFLLVNHPLDCPVCDKGGECPLQDQTMSHGPGESRFVEEKRHFEKPIPISDLVMLDRERCILCDRCTRFASEVAGDPLISFLDRGNETQVNTFPGEPFASYFSGNTVQICPVGALTATPYRFKARPWDLEEVESTCTSCSVGCRVVVQSSRNRVLRYLGVDVDAVNWGWLCDKGRFDFEAVNSSERLGSPLVRDEGLLLKSATWNAALRRATAAIREGLDRSGPDGLAVLGGARLTNEDAYAWVKLSKGIIGSDNVDAQLGDGLPAEAVLGLPPATIDDACRPGGVVLLLGPDPKEELPVLFLRLRHAVLNDDVRIVELASTETGTTKLAAHSLRYRPGHALPLVRALLAGEAEEEVGGVAPEAIEAAAALLADRPVTVLLGRANLAEGAKSIAAAASVIHEAHPQVRFLSALRRANVRGALELGMTPGVLPGRVTLRAGHSWFSDHWPTVPETRGLDAAGILRAASEGRIDTLVLLGADPLADFPDRNLAERGVAGARTVIACDQFRTESVRQADVVMPAAGYAEVAGTTANLEGRVSSLARKVTPPGTAQPDWAIAADLAYRLGADLGLESVEQIAEEIEAVAPAFAGLLHDLASPNGADGVLVSLPTRSNGETAAEPAAGSVAGATDPAAGTEERSSAPEPAIPLPDWRVIEPPLLDAYSLRLVVSRKLYDRGTLVQQSPSLADLAERATLRLHPQDFDRLGIVSGDDVRVTSSRGHVTVSTRPDAAVPRGVAVLDANKA
ncbi:MAG TPA: NADH-quinone oxidoreductase subunit NuoG, partial [Acidimicrobiales bacterium]|nr:NADH-quinone oxidoreductase subunit NuoG [Acidimicrobiales bacterium]